MFHRRDGILHRRDRNLQRYEQDLRRRARDPTRRNLATHRQGRIPGHATARPCSSGFGPSDASENPNDAQRIPNDAGAFPCDVSTQAQGCRALFGDVSKIPDRAGRVLRDAGSYRLRRQVGACVSVAPAGRSSRRRGIPARNSRRAAGAAGRSGAGPGDGRTLRGVRFGWRRRGCRACGSATAASRGRDLPSRGRPL